MFLVALYRRTHDVPMGVDVGVGVSDDAVRERCVSLCWELPSGLDLESSI